MKCNLGLGVGFILAGVAIAVGCTTRDPIIFPGVNGEIVGNGFPASAISQNNLAPDGGGFSNNNQNASISQVKCAFNVPAPDGAATSTGSSTTGAVSAMIVFATANNKMGSGSVNNRQRVYAAYWNGSSFTPPTELTGLNRDEQVVSGAPGATNIAAVVMIPFNTSSYVDPTGAQPQLTRANTGNWVILWDAQTFGTTVPGANQGPLADLDGVHHTVYATIFIKSFADQPLATTNLIGNSSTVGAANGKTAVNLEFGFQKLAPEITAERGGQETGAAVGALQDGFVDSTATHIMRPASDIVSFGAATDTFVHCATFGCQAVDDLSGLSFKSNIGNLHGNVTFGPTFAISAGLAFGFASPGTASYEIGDDTSFIQLFWVQMVTSHGLTGQTFIPTGSSSSAVEIGPAYQLFTANLSLATMTLGASNDANVPSGQSIVHPPASRNSTSFPFASDARGNTSTQVFAHLTTYNNLVFYNWLDASLKGTIGASPGLSKEGQVDTGDHAAGDTRSAVSAVGTVLNVVTGANGTASVSPNVTDITLLGSNGAHSTKTSTVAGASNPSDVGDEFVDVSARRLCSGCGIIGPDEGQFDVVAFVIGRVSTFTANGVIAGATTAGDTDHELWAVLLNPNGSIEAGGTNPRRVSEHSPELSSTSANAVQGLGANGANVTTAFTDGAGDVKIQSSRDGTYDLLAWRQTAGNSVATTLGLNAVVYKTAYIGSQSLAGSALPDLDARLTRPTQVNNPVTAGIPYTGQAAVLTNGWIGSPIAAYDWQGNIAYRCGFQSDTTRISILYLYSDGSDERLFIRQLTTNVGAALATAPTLTLGTEAEIEPTASVSGQFVNNNVSGEAHGNPFHFLPGSHGANFVENGGGGSIIQLSNGVPGPAQNSPGCTNLRGGISNGVDVVQTCDAGPAPSGAGGDVLVVFSKTNVATIVGSGGFDHQVIAVLFSNGAIAAGDRIVLSRGLAENQQSGLINSTLPAGLTGTTQVLNNFAYGGATPKTQLVKIIPNARSASLSPGTLAPSNGTYILLTDFVGNDVSSPVGLFARHFRPRSATLSFVGNFFPLSGTDPVRIDNGTSDSDATFLDSLQNGKTSAVFFQQDNHLWCSETSDGESYTSRSGLSTPFLVDDNFSANGNNFVTQLGFCKNPAKTCDDLTGTIVAIVKQDVNLDQRIYIRVMQ
jgi:hypothetical protein